MTNIKNIIFFLLICITISSCASDNVIHRAYAWNALSIIECGDYDFPYSIHRPFTINYITVDEHDDPVGNVEIHRQYNVLRCHGDQSVMADGIIYTGHNGRYSESDAYTAWNSRDMVFGKAAPDLNNQKYAYQSFRISNGQNEATFVFKIIDLE